MQVLQLGLLEPEAVNRAVELNTLNDQQSLVLYSIAISLKKQRENYELVNKRILDEERYRKEQRL